MTFTLKLTKLKATLYFPHYNLPYWLGNKFRGGFGSVLLKAVCGYLKPECHNCTSKDDCLYYVLYEKDRQKRGKSQPVRPIVFIPPFFGKKIAGKGSLTVEINIFGDYTRYLSHVIYGLRFLGKCGLNKFSKYTLDSITDYFTGETVFDGECINANSITTIDLGRIDSIEEESELTIDYKTPISVEKVPISLNYLLHMVRRRLILFVNEFGNGIVPNYNCEDEIVSSAWKKHVLIHTSKRGGKRIFHAYTGVADYKILDADENTLKFLKIGELIGAGAKSSFGMGFFELKITSSASI